MKHHVVQQILRGCERAAERGCARFVMFGVEFSLERLSPTISRVVECRTFATIAHVEKRTSGYAALIV